MKDLLPDESLVSFAKNEIQARIRSGAYPPGFKISTLDIANSLNISRTPVISAINQLVAEGFLEKLSPRTIVVTQLRLSQIREILQVREMIELYTVDLIIKNLPFKPQVVNELEVLTKKMTTLTHSDYALSNEYETKFHTGFVSLCCNSRIIKQYESNWSVGIVFLLFARSQIPLYRMDESNSQHEKMLQLAKSGSADELRDEIRKHLKIVNDTLDWLLNHDDGNEVFVR